MSMRLPSPVAVRSKRLVPLGEAAVRVVRVRLDGGELPATSCLSAEERSRAARLRHPSDARRWATGRAILRCLVAGEVGLAPAAVPLAADAHGRPRVTGGCDGGLRFNVAHCGEVALFALAAGHEVGVDIERVRCELDVLALAQRFFTAAEAAALAALRTEERAEAFCRCWTRKEAYLKALGVGLSAPLDTFAVPVAAAARCRILSHRQVPGEVTRWWLLDLPILPDHFACLAVETPPRAEPPRVEVMDWPGQSAGWTQTDRSRRVALPPRRVG